MSESSSSQAGFFASLRKLADLALATVQNRLELFAVELQEEKCRLVEVIILAGTVIALGTIAITLLTITVVLACWENGRLIALLGMSVLYLVGAGLAYRSLKARLTRDHPFTSSALELEKDRACLESPK